MYTFANIANNIVVDIHQDQNECWPNAAGVDDGSWVLCNDEIPGLGYSYVDNEFRPVQPFPSWTWENKAWVPPVEYPDGDATANWNEENQQWDLAE